MPWTDIGGNYHWGAGEPGWTAAPEPAPAPEAPLNLPMKPTYMAPPAPVAPPVAAPAAPPPPVAPLGPAISAGGPIGPIPITTGDKLASTLLPPPAHWLSQPKAKNNTLGNISISK